MSYLKFVFIYTVLFGIALAKLQCGVNEVLDECPSQCSNEKCPTHDGQDKSCRIPEKCPEPACKCAFNHRRLDNGTCVHTTKCPPFPCTGLNEEFDPCPLYCPPEDCSFATPTGECPFNLLILVECSPSCRCIKRHWRKNGVCVPYSECFT